MKNVVLILLIFGAFCCEAFAQKRPPRPLKLRRPIITARYDTTVSSKRAPDGWFEINATEDNFKVSFPTKPQKPFDLGNGKVSDVKTIYAQSPQVYYSAIARSVPFVIDDLETLNKIYDSLRDYYVDGSTFTLINDKEIFSDKHIGRERVSKDKDDKYYTRNQTFIIAGELYELNALVEKKFLESSRKDVDKFFASFGLIKPHFSIAEAKSIPKDFNGNVKDNVYRNDFFGFKTTLPDDWLISNSDEKLYVKEMGALALGSSDAKQNDEYEKQSKKINVLLMATEQPLGVPNNTMLLFQAKFLFYQQFSEHDIAAATAKITLEGMGKSAMIQNPKIIRDVFDTKINGKTYAAFDLEMQVQGIPIKQRIYFLKHQGYLLTFTLAYTDDKNLSKLETAFNSTTFDK